MARTRHQIQLKRTVQDLLDRKPNASPQEIERHVESEGYTVADRQMFAEWVGSEFPYRQTSPSPK